MSTPTARPGAVVMAVHRPDPVLLERQVASLRAQTVTNWRCLVGIDGTDPQALRLLLEVIGDDRRFDIREYPDNRGVYRHFERLLREVDPSAGWVALADQDDYWYPEKFATLLPLLSEPGVAAVSGQARVVDADGVVLGRTERRASTMLELLLRNQVTGSLTVFRRDVVDVALPFPEGTHIAMHDHWLGVCAAATGSVCVVHQPVQDYVQHDRNVLGEAPPTRIRDHWRSSGAHGGVRQRADDFARSRWGWRVAMASAVQSRQPWLAGDPGLEAVARGRLTLRLAGAIARNVGARRLRPIAGAGALATAWLWSRMEGTP